MRGIMSVAKQKNIDFKEYIDLMLLNKLSKEDIKNLVECLTIGETYFFRDKKLFEVLRQRILPDLIYAKKRTNKNLKIWSAGCSSGEEAYSMAILIKELIPDYKDWNIKIIATDINYSSLNKAREGIYREWSFRGVDLNIKNKYFNKINDTCYKLNEEIMELVTFHYLNLADPNYVVENMIMNHIDIILCRNVLMYFGKYHVNQIINRFYNMISNEGWFIVAPSESLFLNGTSFVPVNVNNMFLYSKNMKQNNFGELWYKKSEEKELFIQNDMKICSKNEDEYKNRTIERMIAPMEDINSEKGLLKEENLDVEKFEKLARSFANEGNLEEAITWCKKAIAIDKINPLYYYLLASIQQEQGDIDEAMISLKKNIYLDGNFIMAYFDLGNLYLKRGKYKEALKNFDNTSVLLKKFDEDEIVPHSGEMTVGALKVIIQNLCNKGEVYEEK
jgi:chemotaxis protein methyltransferase CheR